MAGDELTPAVIDRHLVELRRSLGRTADADRIVEEVEGHLLDTYERLRSLGRDADGAAAEAVRAFGSAADVAAHMEGIGAMPTTFTRWSGLAGMVGAVAMAAIPLEASSRPAADDGRDPLLVLPAVGGILVVLGLLGVLARTRDAFSRRRLTLAGALVALPLVAVGFGLGWGAGGVVLTMIAIVGFGLFFERVLRTGALPRPATALVATAALALVALSPTSVEKESAPYYLAAAVLAGGWVWLQYTLWSERAAVRR